MAEEFFMNKNAKKLVDLGTALNDSKENIVHLVNIFFQPSVKILWSLAVMLVKLYFLKLFVC